MTPATIRDVAKQAGVGVGTVSRVLNANPAVSEPTRQKVISAIEALDYAPNPIARRLSLGKTLTVAVIVPFFTRPSFVERLRGIEHALANSEYDLVLFNVEAGDKRDDYFRSVPRKDRVDGILVVSLSPRDQEAIQFLRSDVPTVLVDAHHPKLSRVVIDDVTGGYMATWHLIDLGHHSIGFVGDHFQDLFNSFHSRDRYNGHCRALEEAGIPLRPEFHCQGEHGRENARKMAHQLLTLPDPPTAVFAGSDVQAFGVLEAAEDLGLKVPGQLSVIGYDDIEIAEYVRLTTIRQHLFSSGVEGVALLLESMANPFPSPRRVLLPLDLIVRGTTAPPE